MYNCDALRTTPPFILMKSVMGLFVSSFYI